MNALPAQSAHECRPRSVFFEASTNYLGRRLEVGDFIMISDNDRYQIYECLAVEVC